MIPVTARKVPSPVSSCRTNVCLRNRRLREADAERHGLLGLLGQIRLRAFAAAVVEVYGAVAKLDASPACD